jgi:hypothetical protein
VLSVIGAVGAQIHFRSDHGTKEDVDARMMHERRRSRAGALLQADDLVPLGPRVDLQALQAKPFQSLSAVP